MIFESMPLEQIQEEDVRNLLAIGRRESATLEYKELYKQDDRGNKEFLLDVCMFGNSGGGDILIGIPELRTEDGHGTGFPDPAGAIGLSLSNPEQQLLAYESQILDAIDERLPVRMRAVPCADKYVVVVRVPNSLSKPHRVHYQGRTYFPARRERRRYELNAREIKELVMRTATQASEASDIISKALDQKASSSKGISFVIALLPVFATNFSIDLRSTELTTRFAHLRARGELDEYIPRPEYTLEGLSKRVGRDMVLSLSHRGLLKLKGGLPSHFDEINGMTIFFPKAIDIFIRQLVLGSAKLYEISELGPPALLGISINTEYPFWPKYSDWDDATKFPPLQHSFPILTLSGLGAGTEPQIKPLCDHVHQAFQRPGSPYFDASGSWAKD